MRQHEWRRRTTAPRKTVEGQAPCVLQHPIKNNKRMRIQSLNCQTLLADERLLKLDTALTEKVIDICALQNTRRDGLNERTSEN